MSGNNRPCTPRATAPQSERVSLLARSAHHEKREVHFNKELVLLTKPNNTPPARRRPLLPLPRPAEI